VETSNRLVHASDDGRRLGGESAGLGPDGHSCNAGSNTLISGEIDRESRGLQRSAWADLRSLRSAIPRVETDTTQPSTGRHEAADQIVETIEQLTSRDHHEPGLRSSSRSRGIPLTDRCRTRRESRYSLSASSSAKSPSGVVSGDGCTPDAPSACHELFPNPSKVGDPKARCNARTVGVMPFGRRTISGRLSGPTADLKFLSPRRKCERFVTGPERAGD